MKTYTLIWYDMSSEKKRDKVQAENEKEAIRKGYQLYNGNPPAPLVSATMEE